MWPKLYALHKAKGLNSVRLRVTRGFMVRVRGIELLWVGGLGVRLVRLCFNRFRPREPEPHSAPIARGRLLENAIRAP